MLGCDRRGRCGGNCQDRCTYWTDEKKEGQNSSEQKSVGRHHQDSSSLDFRGAAFCFSISLSSKRRLGSTVPAQNVTLHVYFTVFGKLHVQRAAVQEIEHGCTFQSMRPRVGDIIEASFQRAFNLGGCGHDSCFLSLVSNVAEGTAIYTRAKCASRTSCYYGLPYCLPVGRAGIVTLATAGEIGSGVLDFRVRRCCKGG